MVVSGAGIVPPALNRPGVSRSVAFICTLVVGGVIALQPPANAVLSRHVGDIGAAFVSLAISLSIIGVLLITVGHPGRLSGLGAFKPEYAIGGIAGAAVVAISLAAVRPLGAGGVTALLVAAQLLVSIAADRFSWFGLHHVGLGAGRLLGLVLVIGGTLLITRT
jgi:bacterial/archaeal transporter family-2 protein